MSVVTPSPQHPHQRAYIVPNAFDPAFVHALIRTRDQFTVFKFFQSVLGHEYVLMPKSSAEEPESTYHMDQGGEPGSFVMWIATKATRANHFVDADFCAAPTERMQDGRAMLPGDFSVHDTRHTCHTDPSEGYQDSMGFMFIPRRRGGGVEDFLKTYRKNLQPLSKSFMKQINIQ